MSYKVGRARPSSIRIGSSSPLRLAPGSGKAAALLALTGLVLGTLLVAGRAEPEIPRLADGCINEELPAIEVVVIDATEVLKPDEARRLAAEIRRVAAALPTEGRLSILALQPDTEGHTRQLFSRCKPADGAGARSLRENRRMIAAHYRKTFVDPLEAVLAALPRLGDGSTSPIFETIYSVSRAFEGAATSKRLLLASDLIQYTPPLMSMYRTYSWQGALRLPKVRAMEGRLSDVQVAVLLRLHERAASLQGVRHERFWHAYFAYAGVKSLSIMPL